VPPRPTRQETTSADAIAVPGGGNYAPSDRLYDLSVKVAGLERSITYLEGQAENTNNKLDAISDQIIAAKASFNTLKWIFGLIGIGVFGPITTFAFMWMKHYFGW
jgi:hypothetical protein